MEESSGAWGLPLGPSRSPSSQSRWEIQSVTSPDVVSPLGCFQNPPKMQGQTPGDQRINSGIIRDSHELIYGTSFPLLQVYDYAILERMCGCPPSLALLPPCLLNISYDVCHMWCLCLSPIPCSAEHALAMPSSPHLLPFLPRSTLLHCMWMPPLAQRSSAFDTGGGSSRLMMTTAKPSWTEHSTKPSL
jgi:hypothetical protein